MDSPSKRGKNLKNRSCSKSCLIFCLAIFVIFLLPHMKFGGFKERRPLPPPTGPIFSGNCDRPKRRMTSKWPLQAPDHLKNTMVHLSKPGETQYAHMAMIESMANGTLVAAFQASSGVEGSNDQHIVYATSTDVAGLYWTPAEPLPVPRMAAQWSPVMHTDSKGHLWLFYTEGRNCKFNVSPPRWMPGGDIKVTKWTPSSSKWKTPRTIYPQSAGGGVPKVLANKMIVLSSGEWALPYWSEKHSTGTCAFDSTAEGAAGLLVSKNEGWDWEPRGSVTSGATWLIENTVVELDDGKLLMFFRTLKGLIYRSTSADKGYSWTIAEATSLPNPDSKIHMLKLDDGMLALAYNNHGKLTRSLRRSRTFLDVAVSANQGSTWTKLARLESAEQPGLRAHYPTLHQVGCTLYVAYSKFYHEEYAYRSTNSSAELGINLAALDLR
ncbi:hypothetical protein CYMTET_48301 [Cymbomonas tetramitiformis]|uniref:Sialidase domain-containing protein n=1 Tax=Cymbomonas tetramitiformis TaxID=36881 RepID=A0AAE0BUF0_9CHLO|nr:hypothetical protein CYMTET_48301 [Cymbomonas tetramitiformis]